MFLTIVTSVLAGLAIAGILGLAKSHWLYLVVPKLYLNTPLSSGHVISLSLINQGFAAEEDVKIRLKTTCKYEFLAASNSAVAFSNNLVTIPRVGRFETVIALLLVEGKTFELSDVEAVESKHATGKIVQTKEQISTPWQHLVAWPLILFLLLVPFGFGTFIGKTTQTSVLDYLLTQFDSLTPSKQLAGYKIEMNEPHASIAGELAKASLDGRIELKISEIVQRGDILYITIIVANNTKQTLVADVSATSSASERGPLGYSDTRVDDAFIAASAKKKLDLRAFLPEASVPRIVVLSYGLKLGRDTSRVEQSVIFD